MPENSDVCQVKFKIGWADLYWGDDRISSFFGLADSEDINLKYIITNSEGLADGLHFSEQPGED